MRKRGRVKRTGLINGLKGTCWCVSAIDPTPIPREKKRKERGETLTLHYLCLLLLAQADGASHCVFIMRNCYEAKEEDTTGRAVSLSVCVLKLRLSECIVQTVYRTRSRSTRKTLH